MKSPPEIRFRLYRLGDGWEALAGRTDQDNDRLTFEIAAPRDWWLHAKGCAGSHVVLRHPAGETDPSREILETAARIALYHSKAKKASSASVSLARVSDLEKCRGAPAGQVHLRKSRSLKVRLAGWAPPEVDEPSA